MGSLRDVHGFLLDMDGVLYRGDTARHGAIEWVKHLNETDIPYLCLTNNATRSPEQYEAKLDKLRIPIDASRVLGTAETTSLWLSRQSPHGKVLVVGTQGLIDELERHDLMVVDTLPADYVVVGLDPKLTYDKLVRATHAIRAGAKFVGTNPDPTYPDEQGLSPGCGAILAALETATETRPIIVGKPEPIIFREALHRLGLPPAEVAIVGDRIGTDIQGGQRMGLTTALVLGGVTTPEELETSPIRPDYVFEHLADLLEVWREGRA